jgi:hypothetical protein
MGRLRPVRRAPSEKKRRNAEEVRTAWEISREWDDIVD